MNDPNKKTANRRTFLLVAAPATAACTVVPGYALYSKASLRAEESGQRELLAELRKQLSIYHYDHGLYPRSISQLQITIFADGSTPETLKQFSYKSDGTTFTLSCFGPASRQTIVIRPNAAND